MNYYKAAEAVVETLGPLVAYLRVLRGPVFIDPVDSRKSEGT
jgi:hypothetical protein